MPIYIYQCDKCGYQSEQLVISKDDEPVKKCSKCGKGEMIKQPTKPAGGSGCQGCSGSCTSCGL